MRILIIEDDQRLTRLMKRVLAAEKYDVDVAYDGDMGLEMAISGIYDIAIIDWMLPHRDGPTICRAIRSSRHHIAILMLTARGQVEDRVRGLDSGADDYLVKPFAFEELLARVRALSRRFLNDESTPEELRCGDLVMDLRSHTARWGDFSLDLTATEWNLLEFLVRHAGQALSRQQILDYVWSFERDVQPNMVDVYISYVRRKLAATNRPDPITTVRGIGYRFEPLSNAKNNVSEDTHNSL
jgi:DNA-binding response OmpR family regulator